MQEIPPLSKQPHRDVPSVQGSSMFFRAKRCRPFRLQVVQWEDALELIEIAQGLALEVVPQRI